MVQYFISNSFRMFQTKLKNQGPVKSDKKASIIGIKYLSSYLNYQLKGHRYSQSLIIIISLAKSGSTWIANMLSCLDGFNRFAPLKWSENRDDNIYPTF